MRSRARIALAAALGVMLIVSAAESIRAASATASSGFVIEVASDAQRTVRAVHVREGDRVMPGEVLVELESTEPNPAVTQAADRVARADEALSYAEAVDVPDRAASLIAAKDQLARAQLSQPSIVLRAPVAGVVQHTFRGVGEESPSNGVLVDLVSANPRR
jgi:multidrug efflux pump subunit AcrA (membrane-fusion protein)